MRGASLNGLTGAAAMPITRGALSSTVLMVAYPNLVVSAPRGGQVFSKVIDAVVLHERCVPRRTDGCGGKSIGPLKDAPKITIAPKRSGVTGEKVWVCVAAVFNERPDHQLVRELRLQVALANHHRYGELLRL